MATEEADGVLALWEFPTGSRRRDNGTRSPGATTATDVGLQCWLWVNACGCLHARMANSRFPFSPAICATGIKDAPVTRWDHHARLNQGTIHIADGSAGDAVRTSATQSKYTLKGCQNSPTDFSTLSSQTASRETEKGILVILQKQSCRSFGCWLGSSSKEFDV